MDFFNSLIDDIQRLTAPLEQKAYNKEKAWNDAGYNQVILQRDTAFELDGVGFNLVTSDEVEDGVVVIGSNLNAIASDCRFARISIVQIDGVEDEQKAYNLIKKVEYVKYHHFPDGYMIRTSSRSHKEVVRISKAAIKNGISFQSVGSLLIDKYKENPAVKGVKVIFITNPDAPFDKIEETAQKNSRIAETLNHIMNSVKFDCDTCSLKPVCDEVEGMKELHFKTSMGSRIP